MIEAKRRKQWAQICDDLGMAGHQARHPYRSLHRCAVPRDHLRERIQREAAHAQRLHDEAMKEK